MKNKINDIISKINIKYLKIKLELEFVKIDNFDMEMVETIEMYENLKNYYIDTNDSILVDTGINNKINNYTIYNVEPKYFDYLINTLSSFHEEFNEKYFKNNIYITDILDVVNKKEDAKLLNKFIKNKNNEVALKLCEKVKECNILNEYLLKKIDEINLNKYNNNENHLSNIYFENILIIELEKFIYILDKDLYRMLYKTNNKQKKL